MQSAESHHQRCRYTLTQALSLEDGESGRIAPRPEPSCPLSPAIGGQGVGEGETRT